jgi:5-methylcytosine-specific restriction endonuclease McrA
MNWRVLVLDQSYQPINIIHWTEAVRLLFLEKAEIVENADVFPVRSAKSCFNLASIIRVFQNVAHKKKKNIPFSRYNIFLRDNWTCQYCGKVKKTNQLNWDHVFPKSRGGKTNWENIVSSCYPCNEKKRDRTPEEAKMKLLRKPVKPKATPQATIRLTTSIQNVPESWKVYLDPESFAYWHVELQSE